MKQGTITKLLSIRAMVVCPNCLWESAYSLSAERDKTVFCPYCKEHFEIEEIDVK